MKKRVISSVALIAAFMLIFTGCGGSSVGKGVYSTSMAPAAEPMEASSAQFAEANGFAYDTTAETETADFESDDAEAFDEVDSDVPLDNRKIVKHVDMELETKEFDTAFAQILQTVTQNGGYIANQNINGKSLRYNDSYYERYASINARVPSDKLDAVCSSIGGVCNVTSQSEQVEDITERYFDADAHLNSLKLQEERLLDILSKAEELDDVIQLERALSEVRYEIESLSASLRRMDSQVRYSYLNMSLNEVVEYKSVQSPPKTFGEKLADSFRRSGRNLSSFFEGTLFFIIEDLPVVLINIAILAVIVFVAIKFIRLFKRKVNMPLRKFGKGKSDNNSNQ